MTTLKSECRLFSPNIFNRSKCQECFKTREKHLVESLESKLRATRKIAKCGYLFVAPPDWDFSLLINRTKRWQRRWFSLYEDGELTYALDEHPETVPQAIVDMNHAVEVTDAEDLTGNAHSIVIRCSDSVHFVKGTSTKEKKWWLEVLSRYTKLPNHLRCKSRRVPSANTTMGTATTKTSNSSSIHDSNVNNNSPNNKPVLWLYLAANLAIESNKKQGSTANELSERRNWINTNLNGSLVSPYDRAAQEELSKSRVQLSCAREEIKSTRKTLSESHANYDYLEMAYSKLQKEMERTGESHGAQMCLMRQRINDLTGKLSLSERCLKEAKHKMAKYESRQERRRSSLKDRESSSSAGTTGATATGDAGAEAVAALDESDLPCEKVTGSAAEAAASLPLHITPLSSQTAPEASTPSRSSRLHDHQRHCRDYERFSRYSGRRFDDSSTATAVDHFLIGSSNDERKSSGSVYSLADSSPLTPGYAACLAESVTSSFFSPDVRYSSYGKRCSVNSINQGSLLLRSPSCPGLALSNVPSSSDS